MPQAQSNIGTDQRLDVCILERKTKAIAGRSHAEHSLVLRKCLSIPERRVQCVINLHAWGREKEPLSSTRSIQKFRRL
jgi:hypothetical protein